MGKYNKNLKKQKFKSFEFFFNVNTVKYEIFLISDMDPGTGFGGKFDLNSPL